MLAQFGVRPARCVELNWMDTTQVNAVQVTALPARHFSGRSLFNRFETLWASFAFFHSGRKFTWDRKERCAVAALWGGGQGLLMPIYWGLFDLALQHWRQPIEKIWPLEGLKLWSPTPGAPAEVIPGVELRSEWWRQAD